MGFNINAVLFGRAKAMGNCFASCLPSCGKAGNMLSNSRNDFSFLIEERNLDGQPKRSFLSRILERRKERQKKQPIRIVEGVVGSQSSYIRLSESESILQGRDIQLHYLDAKALLGKTDTSTPENSLDLEWEHETLPISTIREPSRSSWTTSIFPNDTLTTQPNNSPFPDGGGGNLTESEGSRVSSSANSLEWDSVQNSIHSEGDIIDTETQYLLNEIDRLTIKALNETGTTVMENINCLENSL